MPFFSKRDHIFISDIFTKLVILFKMPLLKPEKSFKTNRILNSRSSFKSCSVRMVFLAFLLDKLEEINEYPYIYI